MRQTVAGLTTVLMGSVLAFGLVGTSQPRLTSLPTELAGQLYDLSLKHGERVGLDHEELPTARREEQVEG
jgi:hypothetical protein